MAEPADLPAAAAASRQSVRTVFGDTVQQLITDVLPPTRIIVAVTLVASTYLGVWETFLRLVTWLASDLVEQLPVLGWVLVGVRGIAFTATAFYWLYRTIHDIWSLEHFSRTIEGRAKLP